MIYYYFKLLQRINLERNPNYQVSISAETLSLTAVLFSIAMMAGNEIETYLKRSNKEKDKLERERRRFRK
jgi:hypothetical protein